MTIRQQLVCVPLMLTGTIGLNVMRVEAQVNTTLTEQDRAEIQALPVTYRRALFGCEAKTYADLFATPGGYFSSSSRGEVRERQALIEMVLSYARCHSKPAATPRGLAHQAASPLPAAAVHAVR